MSPVLGSYDGALGSSARRKSMSPGVGMQKRSNGSPASTGNASPQPQEIGHNQILNKYVRLRNGKCGTVRFIGQTQFAGGEWVGVELDVPEGRSKLDEALERLGQ